MLDAGFYHAAHAENSDIDILTKVRIERAVIEFGNLLPLLQLYCFLIYKLVLTLKGNSTQHTRN